MDASPAAIYYHLLIAALSRVRRLCREEERSVGRAGRNILLTPSSRHANHLSLLTLAPPKWNSSSILVIMTNGQLRCQGSLGDKALVVRQVVADLAGSGGFVRELLGAALEESGGILVATKLGEHKRKQANAYDTADSSRENGDTRSKYGSDRA